MEHERLFIDTLEETTDKKPDNYLAVLNCGVQQFTDVQQHLIREKGRKEYHLLYIESGTCTAFHRGKRYELSEGQYVLYEPGERQEYIFHVESPSVSYYIHFKGIYADKILTECGLRGGVYTAVNPSEAGQLFPKLVHATLSGTHATETRINGLMFSLLCAFTETNNNTMFHESVRAAVLYLQRNQNRNVKIEELTSLCNLSRSRFMNLFQKNIGTSPHQYHLLLRIERVKKILTERDCSVTEAAAICGFDDPLYFSRIFKKVTGMTPKDFRKTKKSDVF